MNSGPDHRQPLSGTPEEGLDVHLAPARRVASHYAAIMDEWGDAIIALTNSGVINSWNAGAASLLGYPDGEVVGHPIGMLMQGDASDRTAAMAAAIGRGEAVRLEEAAWRHKSGEPLALRMLALPFRDAAGQVSGATVVLRHDGARVPRSEALAAMMESAPAAMVLVDGKGHIVAINAQAESQFGYARAQLQGKPIEVLVPQRYRDGHQAHVGAYFGAPNTRLMGVRRDLFAVRQDGSEFPVEIGLGPMKIGADWFALATVVDISERLRSEAEVRREVERQARERAWLERLAQAPGTAVSARLYGAGPLRERFPDHFRQACNRYGELLEQALERRVHKVEVPVSAGLQQLGDVLGGLRASPRDVIDIHLQAMGSHISDVTREKAAATLEEGRVAVLELMGYLASYYRPYCPGAPARSQPE